MITAIKSLLLFLGLLVCGQAIDSGPGRGVPDMPGRIPGGSGMPGMGGMPGGYGLGGTEGVKTAAPAATLESLMNTIAEGQGRPVYEAFKAVPKLANTAEKQEKAFEALLVYLGQTDKYCAVRSDDPQSHASHHHFSYTKMASEAIWNLGEPGRRGLVNCLTSKPLPVAEQAARILCAAEAAAIHHKGRPESKDFPPLHVDARKALEVFLQQHGNSFSVQTLDNFYCAGLPAAAGYIHALLKATPDPWEKHRAALRLGSYGYEPALDDLLKMFQETPDKGLRGTVRGGFQWFSDSDRVTQAITQIMENTKDEGLRKECQAALQEVAIKAPFHASRRPGR